MITALTYTFALGRTYVIYGRSCTRDYLDGIVMTYR